jgi:hypothetical protein
MRTTVTLDPDVAAKLKRLSNEQGISFKQAINESVRRGLAATPASSAYRLRTRPLGAKAGIDLEHGLRLAGELEDAETLRKLSQRK